MKLTYLIPAIIATQSATAASIRIDLDLTTPGVQSSITNAIDGQSINFALVATDFDGDIHCFNGIGGDISSKGSMSVAFDSTVNIGEIVTTTANGVLWDMAPPFISFIPETPKTTPGVSIELLGLAPLTGYTKNVGGIALRDRNSEILDANGHVISFTNVPGGSVPYITIFTASMTLSNVSGNTLDLFPSGVFNNPPTQTDVNGDVGLNSSTPFSFEQNGEILLHTKTHDFDDACVGLGSGTLTGASITGIPEPSSTLLLGIGSLALVLRRKRVA